MLAPDELQALTTVLKKVFQSNNRLAQATEAKRLADENHAIAWRDFEMTRAALVIFGFDVADEELWTRVREAVGEWEWMDAQRRAAQAEIDLQPDLLGPGERAPELNITARDISYSVHDIETVLAGAPTVREVVLAQLVASGDEGTTATQLRKFYEHTYGRALHEKTIGMTLYRLSKDGKVKRFGRTWFITPAGRDGAEAGGDTSGVFG